MTTPYDPRLDSDDVVVRQQAELEALRTALIASRSDSDGEIDRLRQHLQCMTESYEGQKRNTITFMRELDAARCHITELESKLSATDNLG